MKSQIRIAVAGARGRMGQEVIDCVAADKSLLLAAKVERESGDGCEALERLPGNEVDILIDFTAPEAFTAILGWCEQNRCPLVSGTTGLSGADVLRMREVSQSIPLFWAPNMSLGIAIMTRMIADLASLPEADFQVEEHHHRFKKDRPSGTAKWLQDELLRHADKEVPDPLVVRGGGIFGVHRIYAMGLEEVLMMEHVALNRRVFASGAIRAAQWVVRQPPGLYNMQSLLSGLKK